jgi:hypothetical protein
MEGMEAGPPSERTDYELVGRVESEPDSGASDKEADVKDSEDQVGACAVPLVRAMSSAVHLSNAAHYLG